MSDGKSEKEIRVLVVTPWGPTSKGYGGVPRSCRAYVSAYMKLGFDVFLICSSSNIGAKITKDGVERAFPGIGCHVYDPLFARGEDHGTAKRLAICINILPLIRQIAQADFVQIHCARVWVSTIAALLCRLMGKRYVVIAHANLDVSRMVRTKAKRPRLYALSEAVVNASVMGAEAIVVSGALERNSLPPKLSKMRAIEIENFFDYDPSQMAVRSLNKDAIRYVFVGRLEADKGIRKFIQIWQRASQPTSRLSLIGSGFGDYADSVKVAASRDDRIDYLGELPYHQVMHEIEAADILVLPTGLDDPVTENFGNVIVEALIAGRPAMVPKGLHWDQYADNPAIVSFDCTEDGVAEAIQRFEGIDAEIYDRMSRSALELARHFHANSVQDRLSKLVRSGL